MSKTYIFKAAIIPVLMLTDYYLTIYGDSLRKKAHAIHFQIENYELNPVWVKDIKKKTLINIKHLLLIVLFSLFIGYFICRPEVDSSYNRILYGAIITVYFVIISRHISNALIYKFAIDNPYELKGEIVLSPKYTYIASAYQYLVCLGAILPLAILSCSDYVYGGLIGSIVLIFIHLLWYRKHKKNLDRQIVDADLADSKNRVAD